MLLQLWTRTGGGNDLVSDNRDTASATSANSSKISEITKQLNEITSQLSKVRDVSLIRRIEELEARQQIKQPEKEPEIDTRYLAHIGLLRKLGVINNGISTNNAIAKFDGNTGRIIEESGVLINSSNDVVMPNGAGFDFSLFSDGSVAGVKTSQILLDYEEGTWTPAIEFGGGTTGITYSAQAGFYTKIGQTVFFNCTVQLTNKGSSTGIATLSGLPYTSQNTANNHNPSMIRAANITFSAFLQPLLSPNSTALNLQDISAAGTLANLDDTSFANNSSVMLSGQYSV